MPDPNPSPQPDPTPVAVPSDGHALPAEPLRRSAVPAGVKPHLGRLVSYVSPTGRPLVGVLVLCRKCGRLHRYPWRWDWGAGLDVVSNQEARCSGKNARKPTWVALDPAADAENQAVHQEAHVAFEGWLAGRAAKKAARAAVEEEHE